MNFQSFFMGGFECADHINRAGIRVNLLKETDHHRQVFHDYQLLKEVGITTVREGICWSEVEKVPYQYDFSEVKNRILAANQLGIQQLWDICHFGYPSDMMPTHPLFSDRFSKLCAAFAHFHAENSNNILFVVPINEISFLSWHSGDVRGTVPFAVNSGFDIKYHLCKAAIKGIEALKMVNPNCRIMTIEPLIKIHPNFETGEIEHIDSYNENQFQAMDIIGGRLLPELEGRPEYLDIIGINYYYNNQWIHNGIKLDWPTQHPQYMAFSKLLIDIKNRYNRPIIISETGHFGDLRDVWLEEITQECLEAMQAGVNLQGICIYPVLDRPDWDDLTDYCQCGLWDLDENKQRMPHHPYLDTLADCIESVKEFAREGEFVHHAT
jgi:beta-glucosidase/6-phospho-beta-glucosidase/beta-galactosidase